MSPTTRLDGDRDGGKSEEGAGPQCIYSHHLHRKSWINRRGNNNKKIEGKSEEKVNLLEPTKKTGLHLVVHRMGFKGDSSLATQGGNWHTFVPRFWLNHLAHLPSTLRTHPMTRNHLQTLAHTARAKEKFRDMTRSCSRSDFRLHFSTVTGTFMFSALRVSH